MAYRLILVDDEADIRDGMKRIVDFEKYGFHLVGEADNGMDGLQLAEQVRPDLVITDIRMHFMDGLEMIEKIRTFLPMTQFVVLSGYDEFQYVRRSIQMRIVDYVLKPISSVEFEQVLARAQDAIDQEYLRRRNTDLLNEYLRANLPALREQLLCSLLSDGLDDRQAWEKAERYGMRLKSDHYATAILQVMGEPSAEDRPLKGDAELVRVATDNLVRDVLSERLDVHVFNYNGRVAVVCLLKEEQLISLLMEALDTACGVVYDYLGVRCVAGVGEPCANLSELSRSCRQALNALDHWTLIEDGNVIYANDLHPDADKQAYVEDGMIQKLINAIKVKHAEEIAHAVKRLLDGARAAHISFYECQMYLLEALVSVLRAAREMNADGQVLRESHRRVMEDFITARGLEQMEELMLSMCEDISKSISINRLESGHRIVKKALELLAARFSEEALTIESVVDELHISPSYFRTVFKRETGQTFHQYLTTLRMDRAMDLLHTTDMKTAHIAELIGLGEASYFSYSFKKYFGVSPSQVRKDAANG